MGTKSPTMAVRSREIIGVEQFSQRREVFDQHDTVFLPAPSSPTALTPAADVDPIITSNHGKTTANFRRNTPGYSSMRETTKTDEDNDFEYRPRKYSDNFASELNQSDDVDYRRSMTERTRRLSKLRRDFLTSNLHEPSYESPFNRVGTRASMPARSITVSHYKIESPNLYKFPFAEPYSTPTPVRKVVLDFGQISDQEKEKENEDPEAKSKYQSLPINESPTKIDHQKMFEELVKRYSPERKSIDWKLPPTRPRVVASIPKSTSSVSDTLSDVSKKQSQETLSKTGDDEVFKSDKSLNDSNEVSKVEMFRDEVPRSDALNDGSTAPLNINDVVTKMLEAERVPELKQNGPDKNEVDSKTSSTELEEKNDKVPELKSIQRQISKESAKRSSPDTMTDLSIPALIDKISADGEGLEKHNKQGKKVKRKRSFLDKLLGRNKNRDNKIKIEE